jgi:hypothetical protein
LIAFFASCVKIFSICHLFQQPQCIWLCRLWVVYWLHWNVFYLINVIWQLN